MAAVAFDSPATNELASPLVERNPLSLCGIWMGRSYEAVSVYQKTRVLEWLAERPFVDSARIAVSGHSLGAKPADILGVLCPERVKAVVHNDFVCHWQERSVACNLEVPGNHQIVPGIFQWFDYTDLEAALAPMPLLFTEGGRLNQIAKIRKAYALHGAEDALRVYHYEKYSDPASRLPEDTGLPMGLSMDGYFRHANVDAAMHRFRPAQAVPWLAGVFALSGVPLFVPAPVRFEKAQDFVDGTGGPQFGDLVGVFSEGGHGGEGFEVLCRFAGRGGD